MKAYIQANRDNFPDNYAFYYPEYAKLLSARWAELTGTEDACDFLNEGAGFRPNLRGKV